MKPQAEIGGIEGQRNHERDSSKESYHRHSSTIRACRLTLALLAAVGTAELTIATVTNAAPQTANSQDTTSQLAVQAPAQNWQPQITVRLHNYAQVDSQVLLGSEQIVSDILRKAGVETVWLACTSGEGSHSDPDCAKPLSPADLNLNLPKPNATKLYHRADSVYGFTLENNAWVFFDRVKASASELQLNTAHILGNVIAHELGHLLLGENAHSNWGLMRAWWSPQQLMTANRGELSFSNIERVKIRNIVIASHQTDSLAQAQHTPDTTISMANNEIPAALRDGFLNK